MVTALLAGSAWVAAAQDAAVADFERQQVQRAEQAQLQGRWAEAARAWEVLVLLRPEQAEYRQNLQLQRRAIEQLAAQLLARAGEELRRGDLDRATRGYLQLLSVQPENTVAADALRQIERERNERQWQGRFARNPLQRPPTEALAGAGERNIAEHAALLASQGELESAISLLSRPAQAPGADPALRRQLVELLLRRIDGLASDRRAELVPTLREILRLDPQHEEARARLRSLGEAR